MLTFFIEFRVYLYLYALQKWAKLLIHSSSSVTARFATWNPAKWHKKTNQNTNWSLS